jgi:uncharacterized protein (TIGR00369 family)
MTSGSTHSWRAVLDAIRDGSLAPPPAASLLGIELLAVADGRTTFRLTSSPTHGNPTHVHGGVLATVADFAATTAVASALPAGADVVTADLHVSYVRRVALDAGPLLCHGRLLHLGRTQANAEAVVVDDAGELVLQGLATCRVIGAAAEAAA